jgi:ATP/maltotriose-dependent transcriptional regulator MalT
MISLGTAEQWAGRTGDAERHLDEGTHLAHEAKRPRLEIEGLTRGAWVAGSRSFRRAAERFARAIELAGENDWADRPLAAPAYAGLSTIRTWQMRLEEAETLLDRAERATGGEARILRYLPTNLPAPEIARWLCLSVHIVRTHTRHLYEKLSVHSRTQAVEQARALGLLAPSAHGSSR